MTVAKNGGLNFVFLWVILPAARRGHPTQDNNASKQTVFINQVFFFLINVSIKDNFKLV